MNIKKFSNKNGKYILGFRAEDATISKSSKGNIKGPIFSIELLGDAIMVTLKIDESFISVKVNNDFEAYVIFKLSSIDWNAGWEAKIVVKHSKRKI